MQQLRILQSRLLWGLLLGLLGFAGNWFKFELFFNVDFLFGSLFVMLALVRFGAVAGIIAGVIASSCTFLLWNHPWAIIIMTAEAVFVAWRLRAGKRDCLTADIIFWLGIGLPLAYKTIAERMGISPHTVHNHIKNIYEKLHAGNRIEALNRARKIGIL